VTETPHPAGTTVVAADVEHVVVETWSSLLGIDPVRLPGRHHPATGGTWVQAVVTVEGPWNGTVRLSAPAALAALCASRMLDVPPSEVDIATVEDAFGELANVVGGNLKSLMPPVCHLSLPSVVHAAGQPAAQAMTLAFDCAGDELVVGVHPAERPVRRTDQP
jgi:chemotaxis protein CheX